MGNDDQPPIMNPFAAQQHVLRERLHHLLATLHALLKPDVIVALEGEGKLLSQPPPGDEANSPGPALAAGVWPLLTLLVAQHISPDIDPVYASSVAVAVECFVCAIDLLDDTIDEDQTPTVQALGTARVLNVSTALLVLAQQALISLSELGVPHYRILQLLDALQEAALTVAAGQQWDVLVEQRSAQDITYEECMEIVKTKAASIMRLACRLGALCAGASYEVREQFSELGELLGIAHQLDNDSHDLYYLLEGETFARMAAEATGVKSDLVRGKKTLPVVLAASRGYTLQRLLPLTDEEKEEYLHALHESIITTWGICLLYRERARDRLQEIEAQRPIAPALHLLLGL
jgi:geranylgeranyl pyrophosphate synthase